MGMYDWVFGLILLGVLGLLILDRFEKTKVSMLGAGLALFFAILPGSGQGITGGQQAVLVPDIPTLLELIEPDLMLIIIGMTMLVSMCARTGLFEYLALKILKRSKGRPMRLFILLNLLIVLTSAFLDAYMALLLIGSITLASLSGLVDEDGNVINPQSYLLAEAMFSNIGGMFTLIASPPNLIIGSYFQIPFIDFTLMVLPIGIVSVGSTLIILCILFQKDLKKQFSADSIMKLLQIDERVVIRDEKGFNVAILILALTLSGFVFSSFLTPYLKIKLGYIAMAGGFTAVSLLVQGEEGTREALKKVEWPIVFFFAGLLLLVSLVKDVHLLDLIAFPFDKILAVSEPLGIGSFLVVTFLVGGVIDNVPMAAILTSVVDTIAVTSPGVKFPLILATITGSNLSGNLTPIGSASAVQVVSMLNDKKSSFPKITFLRFFKVGILASLVSVIFGVAYTITLYFLF